MNDLDRLGPDMLESVDWLPREMIEGCSDDAQLAVWFTSRVEISADIRAMIDGLLFAEAGDPAWLHRAGTKLGYLRIEGRRIEQRMLALGFAPPYPLRDPRFERLRMLEGKVERMTKELRKAGIVLVEGRDGHGG